MISDWLMKEIHVKNYLKFNKYKNGLDICVLLQVRCSVYRSYSTSSCSPLLSFLTNKHMPTKSRICAVNSLHQNLFNFAHAVHLPPSFAPLPSPLLISVSPQRPSRAGGRAHHSVSNSTDAHTFKFSRPNAPKSTTGRDHDAFVEPSQNHLRYGIVGLRAGFLRQESHPLSFLPMKGKRYPRLEGTRLSLAKGPHGEVIWSFDIAGTLVETYREDR